MCGWLIRAPRATTRASRSARRSRSRTWPARTGRGCATSPAPRSTRTGAPPYPAVLCTLMDAVSPARFEVPTRRVRSLRVPGDVADRGVRLRLLRARRAMLARVHLTAAARGIPVEEIISAPCAAARCIAAYATGRVRDPCSARARSPRAVLPDGVVSGDLAGRPDRFDHRSRDLSTDGTTSR